MTKVYHVNELNEGENVYYSKEVVSGWSRLGVKYVQTKVARITPKKTKAVLEDGKELDRYSSVYKELDQGMIDETNKTVALDKICDNVYELECIKRNGTYRSLSCEKTMEVADLLEKAVKLFS